MQMISELESGPRGVYTGCVGSLRAGRPVRFSVAIRTAWLDVASGYGESGVGSGIVWDSSAAAEYDECLLKGRALTTSVPDFEILETILLEPEGGYYLLDRHLGRLERSAGYFGYPLDDSELEARLQSMATSMPAAPVKVRVLVARDGSLEVQRSPIVDRDISTKCRSNIHNIT